MVVVHERDSEWIESLDDIDLRKEHQTDHQQPEVPLSIDHDEDWWEWRRVVLAEAVAEVGDETPDGVDAELADMTGPGPAPAFDPDARTVPGVHFESEDGAEEERSDD